MQDELVSALLPSAGLRVVLASTAGVARHARGLQHAAPASAQLLSQGFTSAILLAALQKEHTRINLQLECAGPLRGFFVDASSDGTSRGYVKNPHLVHEGAPGSFHWRAALGNSGFLSVLRQLENGEFYRSSVELQAFDVARDMETYFEASEQVETRLELAAAADGDEPLGHVVGVLLQPLPEGDRAVLEALGDRLQAPGFLQKQLEDRPKSLTHLASAIVGAEHGELEWMSRYPLQFKCTCSRERVLRALLSMGKPELEDMAKTEGRAEVTCEFCTEHYVVEQAELVALARNGELPG